MKIPELAKIFFPVAGPRGKYGFAKVCGRNYSRSILCGDRLRRNCCRIRVGAGKVFSLSAVNPVSIVALNTADRHANRMSDIVRSGKWLLSLFPAHFCAP
jgi:hypothetical protein